MSNPLWRVGSSFFLGRYVTGLLGVKIPDAASSPLCTTGGTFPNKPRGVGGSWECLSKRQLSGVSPGGQSLDPPLRVSQLPCRES